MIATGAVAAGLLTTAALQRRPVRHAPWWGVLAATALVAPPLAAVGLGAAVLVWVLRRRRDRKAQAVTASDDVVLLADLLALGLGAGLGLPAALDEAARGLEHDLASELAGVRRTMEQSGAEVALAAAGGHAERLYRLLGRAATTGAPLIGAVESFAADRRHEQHTRRLEAARRLPVRLLLPLALLILPGFAVLAVGPALLEALARLEFSF